MILKHYSEKLVQCMYVCTMYEYLSGSIRILRLKNSSSFEAIQE